MVVEVFFSEHILQGKFDPERFGLTDDAGDSRRPFRGRDAPAFFDIAQALRGDANLSGQFRLAEILSEPIAFKGLTKGKRAVFPFHPFDTVSRHVWLPHGFGQLLVDLEQLVDGGLNIDSFSFGQVFYKFTHIVVQVD